MEHAPGFRDLLSRVRGGDPSATDELLVLIRPWLEQLARTHADAQRTDGSVSDLVQEAWLRAWQKLDQFQGAEDEVAALAMFRAWLARIVARLGLNAVRDRSAGQRKPPGRLLRLDGPVGTAARASAAAPDRSAAEPTPSANAQAEEQARLVQDAIAQLSDQLDRDIVRLRFFEGMSLRQIAHQFGCNHETVRQHYHAILGQLQQELNGLC